MDGYQILLLIAHQTRYADFPLWIRICKPIRRKLIEIFKTVLLTADKPDWINKLVLPMSEWCPNLYAKHLPPIKKRFSNELKFFYIRGFQPAVVSGGALCQKFFDREWACCIDIFYESSSPNNNIIDGCGIYLRPVSNTNAAITQSDCSLLQTCYDDKNEEIYFTPLFMLSLLTKKAYWTTYSNKFRLSTYSARKEIDDIFSLICIHNYKYYDCDICTMDIEYNINAPVKCFTLQEWVNRVKKYKTRFHDFEFCLLNLPNIEIETTVQKKKRKWDSKVKVSKK